MTIDFDAIREENIRRFGTETAHLELLANLYSDQTHFIYELLQNAEDAGARAVEFHLRPEVLEVVHDGRPFDDADVRGVCAVGKGTKGDDVTKIGRFGVGFKSVYAFTKSPSIHSDENHFCIRDYVRPEAVAARDVRDGWTLISLPFGGDVEAEAAVEEIDRGLTNLDDRSLLFLQNVNAVTYFDHVNDWKLEHRRTREADGAASRLTIAVTRDALDDDDGRRGQQVWMVWGRPLDAIGIRGRKVELAILVSRDDDAGAWKPQRLVDPPLVAFFPTDRVSHLGMLLQAPFRTTPARDNIPQRDATNKQIVQEAAELLVEVLEDLRDRDLINAELLASLPLDPEHFPLDAMLRPLHDAVVEAFKIRALVPVAGGGYRTSDEVAIGRNERVRALLTRSQLEELLGSDFDWVSPSVGDPFRSFLRTVCDVDDFNAATVVMRMDEDFLAAQPAEWIDRLYAFLGDSPELSKKAQGYSPPGVALQTPIIRIADGSHRLPYDDEGHPTAYLPGPVETELPQVEGAVMASDEAEAYLRKVLGFSQPDLIAELSQIVIPKYEGCDVADLDSDEYPHHVDLVLEALDGDESRTKRLRETLDEVPFVVGVEAVERHRKLCRVSELTFPTEETLLMLGDEPGRLFLDLDYYEGRLPDDLMPLAAIHRIRPTFKKPNWDDSVTIFSYHGRHKRGLARFDPDADCPDIIHGVKNPTHQRALWLWNEFAIAVKHLIAGTTEHATRQDYSNARQKPEVSPLGKLLRTEAWLPGPEGFAVPNTLELDELPDAFVRDQRLAEVLGLRTSRVRELSAETNISVDVLQGLAEDPELMKEVEELVARKRAATAATAGDAAPEEPFDRSRYNEELEANLVRSTVHDAEAPVTSGGMVRNPALRRERVEQQIGDDQESEPALKSRFRVVPKRRWEAKRNETREALTQLYGGRCQVCTSSFPKANGEPYFEGLYLVSYTKASWIDRLGNVLSLCATCSAKFQHGQVDASKMLTGVRSWRAFAEGGDGTAEFPLELAGQRVMIRFKERHLLDLQSLMTASTD